MLCEWCWKVFMDAESLKLALNGKLGLDTEGQKRTKFKDVKASDL